MPGRRKPTLGDKAVAQVMREIEELDPMFFDAPISAGAVEAFEKWVLRTYGRTIWEYYNSGDWREV